MDAAERLAKLIVQQTMRIVSAAKRDSTSDGEAKEGSVLRIGNDGIETEE